MTTLTTTQHQIARAFHAADSFYEFVATYPSLVELYNNAEIIAILSDSSRTDVRMSISENDYERQAAALEYVEDQATEDQPINEFNGEPLVFLDIDSAGEYAEQVAEKLGCMSIDRQAVCDILQDYGLLLFQFFGSFRTYYKYSEARRTYAETGDLTETLDQHFYGKEDHESLDALEIFGIDAGDLLEALSDLHEIRREAVYSELDALLKNGAKFEEIYADVCSACEFVADSNDEDLALEYFSIN